MTFRTDSINFDSMRSLYYARLITTIFFERIYEGWTDEKTKLTF